MDEGQQKPLRWSVEKDTELSAQRDIDFETVAKLIRGGEVLAVVKHHNPEKYPNQRIFILKINEYVYLVPFVENDQEIFLKTIIPSRKMTKKYLGE